MKKNHFWMLPLFLALTNVLACFVPYAISVHTGFVDPILPYVSDAGSGPIAAHYFGLFLDMCAFLVMIIGWIRYKQLNFYFENIKTNVINVDCDMAKLETLNRRLLYAFFLTAWGLIGVGNFRLSETFYLHWMFAFLIIFPTSYYLYFTCYMSRILSRFALYAGDGVTFNAFFDLSFRLHWPKNQAGYVYHCLSSVFEWLIFLSNVILCFCLSNRFRQFKQWNRIEF
ncbi:DNA damage-regulated autophagy modulator protein 2 [Dermatophagoides farinae]|uniref:DNA damage-regulated autophagy modulator protein 2 n=1 Tax=Dermatophagoides farinae TaxID=6954 RepID=UPI001F0D35E4|nr:DNA damage-regulated autophagy modulator protein 2-like isoform X2 [Dermatophagoides farinae]